MNLTITKEQISHGLQSVQNVVSTRTTLPILSNVLLRADGNRLEMTATDLDVTITVRWKPRSRNPALRPCPSKSFSGIVRELANPEIELETDDKNVTSLRSGSSFFKIRGWARKNFLLLPSSRKTRRSFCRRRRSAECLEDLVCDFDRTNPLRPQRHLHDVEGAQVDHGGDGWPPTSLVDEEVDVSRKRARAIHRARQGRQRVEPAFAGQRRIDIRYTDNQAAFA